MAARPQVFQLTPSNADASALASGVSGTTLTPTTTTTPDGLAHRLTILNNSGVDFSNETAIFTGKTADGQTVSETVTGPAASAAATTDLYFTDLDNVVLSSAGAGTFDLGFNGQVVSNTLPLDHKSNAGKVTFEVIVSASATYSVQQSFNNVLASAAPYTWINHTDTDLVSAETSQSGNYNFVPQATRVKVHDYVTGASLRFTVLQANNN